LDYLDNKFMEQMKSEEVVAPLGPSASGSFISSIFGAPTSSLFICSINLLSK